MILSRPGQGRPGAPRLARWLGAGLALLIALGTWLPVATARADTRPEARAYLCDGEPLRAELVPGAVDAVGIPNTLAGTLPGAYLVLQWRGVQLQLPRTNNAGAPTFSDGKWAWNEANPDHPRLLLRRPLGDVQEFACEAQA